MLVSNGRVARPVLIIKEHAMSTETIHRAGFELRNQSLLNPGRALAFHATRRARVDMDALGKTAFNNFLYARAFVGREFHAPCVRHVQH